MFVVTTVIPSLMTAAPLASSVSLEWLMVNGPPVQVPEMLKTVPVTVLALRMVCRF